MRRSSWGAALVLIACQGDGSELGPTVPRLPDESYRILVQDDLGRGVVNARVSIGGDTGTSANTRRSGRVELTLTPTGRRIVDVDATGAVATDVDRLGSLRFAADMQPTDHLPFVVRLPDLAGSAAPDVAVGVLGDALVLDDSAWSGAVLRVPAGSTVGGGGGETRVTVRTGSLRGDHVPPLRLPDGSSAVVATAIDVDPLGLTFEPGGSLSAPNDLGLPIGGAATVFRLHPADGEWRPVGAATVDGDGRLRAADGSIGGGGLYAFATSVVSTATVVGTAIEPQLGVEPPSRLGGVRVRAGQVFGIADGSGRFVLDGVPVVDAAGAPRRITLQVSGGRLQSPSSEERLFDAGAGAVVDLGEITLDVVFTTDVRVLVIERGRVFANADLGIGSRTAGDGSIQITDADGLVGIESIDAGYIGCFGARPDPTDLFRVKSISATVAAGPARSVDFSLFSSSEPWAERDAEFCALFVLDSRSLAAVEGARVYRLRGGVDQAVSTTLPDRIDLVDLRADETVAALTTSSGGRRFNSAFAVRPVSGGRVEMEVLRAPRPQTGAFVPFGFVTGNAPSSGSIRRARATGVVTAETWTDAIVDDRPLDAEAPVRREPSRDGGTAFELGVPSQGGSIVAWTGTASASGTAVVELTFADGLRPPPGTTTPLDLGPALPFGTEFVIPGAAAAIDPLVAAGEFRLDLGIQLASGHVLDVLRGLPGHATTRGDDVVVDLPALTGPLAGARHLVRWRGQSTAQDVVRSQAVFARLGGSPVTPRAALPLPSIASPEPGAHVPVAGFEVRFSLPVGCAHGIVRLHSDDGVDLRDWTVLVPPSGTVASFRRLPVDPQILAPGSYTVEVIAVRDDDGLGKSFSDSFGLFTARWRGIGNFERGVDAISSVRFRVEVDG